MSPTDWSGKLATDPREREQVATELLLHAMRSAAEPESYRMLSRLIRSGSSTIAELMDVSGLGRLAVLDRMNRLMQAGLVSRSLESENVVPTRLADGLVGFMDEVAGRLCRKIEERLPALLAGGK